MKGFSLVELMIAIAVASILGGLAVAAYQGYVSSSRESAMLQVMQSVKIYEEDRRVRLGEYVEGAYDPSNPSVSGGLATTLGWNPTDPDPDISILAACATDGSAPECARGSAIEITATHTQGETICRSYNGNNTSDC
jgi:prepilin-type N-terminal cleavage/methylation domain-containing protein